ncbi:hypothetical protein KDN24_23720 [Bacillus sp. Bva_UNVM-123]|uniref:hypothetical protein n=1 Tax=Bacillus sp. Bva_UNVM-123 TaxID=2829798 RepID=UPI00391F2626
MILEEVGEEATLIIRSVKQTGLTINEQPEVRLQITFSYRFETIEKEIKMIANLLAPPQVGDCIQIIYDSNDKVYLLEN